MKKKQVVSRIIIIILLILVAFIMMVPFIWMVLGSVKMKSELFAVPLKWLPEKPVWKNYSDVFEKVPFMLFYWNTAKVAVLATLGQVLTCAYRLMHLPSWSLKEEMCCSFFTLQH